VLLGIFQAPEPGLDGEVEDEHHRQHRRRRCQAGVVEHDDNRERGGRCRGVVHRKNRKPLPHVEERLARLERESAGGEPRVQHEPDGGHRRERDDEGGYGQLLGGQRLTAGDRKKRVRGKIERERRPAGIEQQLDAAVTAAP
jgi:hypothetical protein